MALFGKTKKEKEVEAKKEKTSDVVLSHRGYSVLRDPRITEKATIVSERGAYVFNVDVKAKKHDIMKAVEAIYKVKPVKVNVVNIRGRRVVSRMRNLRGSKGGGRKAYVYLKKGETLEIV